MAGAKGKEVVTQSELLQCPIHLAYGEEVHMFTHVHLRGYDEKGEGKQMHAEYYDKYGAPMKLEHSWLEGYRAVEQELAEHFNATCNQKLPFPQIACSAGGSHLYDCLHAKEPWNWTGWVPSHKLWCCVDKFYPNRHFISLRGNEIQNDVWNYHPHDEDPGSSDWDARYNQLIPRDRYQGGYFYYTNTWGRYLHLITLKSMEPSPWYPKRYNYIVHPLAYRYNMADYPDNSVDAMQWCINNVNSRKLNKIPTGISKGGQSPTRPAFGNEPEDLEKWGEKCHGFEIFNDFTYYYSSTPLDDGDDWKGGNGYLHDGRIGDYIHWFNSYPHEMGEFLFETSLNHGSYIQVLAANDAMYKRDDIEVQYCDPKSKLTTELRRDPVSQDLSNLTAKNAKHAKSEDPKEKAARAFLAKQPYKENTVFGHIALIDPELNIRTKIYGPPPHRNLPDLDQGELIIFDHMIDGRFFGHTGVYNIFNWKDSFGKIQQHCPIMIENQDPRNFYYEYNEDLHDLAFTMPKAKKPCPDGPADSTSIAEDIIWQMTVTLVKKEEAAAGRMECHRMYFKLNEEMRTKVDLEKTFDENEVAWVRVQGYDRVNPQRRAWFQAIRGPAFEKLSGVEQQRMKMFGKDPKRPTKAIVNPPIDNFVHNMSHSEVEQKVNFEEPEKFCIYRSDGIVSELDKMDAAQLIFDLPKVSAEQEDDLFVYNLQVHNFPPNFKIPTARKVAPPAYLQNVCGVFQLSSIYTTKLDLNSGWDKKTVKDQNCYFYRVDKEGKIKKVFSNA